MDTRSIVQRVFRRVFDDPEIDLRENISPDTYQDWGSIQTVSLVLALEDELGIQFSTDAVAKFLSSEEIIREILNYDGR
jgi:acyl carrier protein